MTRIVNVTRKTKETDIFVNLNLDGTGKSHIATGIGFLDHMLEGFSKHGFFDLTCEAGNDAVASLSQLLPAAGSDNFYRITLTGESEALDIDLLEKEFSQFPNLTLRDRTELPMDIWANVGEDSLEGVYFGLLQQQLEGADEDTREKILLAAKLSRRILENREVKLP